MPSRGVPRGRGSGFGGGRGGSGGRGGIKSSSGNPKIRKYTDTKCERRSRRIPTDLWTSSYCTRYTLTLSIVSIYAQTPVEMGSFTHACEGEMVCESINTKIPYFNAPIYLENKVRTLRAMYKVSTNHSRPPSVKSTRF